MTIQFEPDEATVREMAMRMGGYQPNSVHRADADASVVAESAAATVAVDTAQDMLDHITVVKTNDVVDAANLMSAHIQGQEDA